MTQDATKKVKAVHMYDSHGRFYLNRSEQQRQLVLSVFFDDNTKIAVSDLFDPDDSRAEFAQAWSVMHMLDVLQERLQEYWYCSDRDTKLERLEALRAVQLEAQVIWCTQKLKAAQQALVDAQDELADAQHALLDYEHSAL
jgi:hypothetical protein